MSVLSRPWPRSPILPMLLAAVWAMLLTAVLALPWALGSATLGDDLTRGTVRLALAYYGVGAALMTRLRPEEWRATGMGAVARLCWTLGWLAYLVHLGMAFHHYHDWSHTAAVEHTRQVSGLGEGIYVSHLFTLVWTMDVLWWWLAPAGYAARPAWLARLVHGFMAFIIFNATVVYEQGPIRWAGLVLLSGLAVLVVSRPNPVLPGPEAIQKG